MKRIILILMAAVCMAANCQDHLSGMWHGDLSVGANKLPVTLDIKSAEGEYTAVFGSPAQGAPEIPAEIIVNGDSIEVTIPSVGARYTGVYADETIKGLFVQQGITFPLTMERGGVVFDRPQTPKKPYPYSTREVTIVNSVDSTVLHGTLTLPVQYNMPMIKTFPAVVMVTGSGIQNRDEEIAGHRPFAVIAHHLALNGIASLRCDDRGFGNKAEAVDATTMTFASDAAAALKWLRDSVDRIGAVGVLGHSEGGTITFLLAGGEDIDARPDFVVSMAGMAVNGTDLLIKQNGDLVRQALPGATADQYVTALGRVLEFMKANPGVESWPGLDEAVADLTYLTPELKDNLKTIIESRNPWLDFFIALDPSESIAATTMPVMAINGESDTQVDCDTNLSVIRRLLPAGDNNLIKSYPGLNHLFQHSRTGLPQEYPMIDETISEEVLTDISRWIKLL